MARRCPAGLWLTAERQDTECGASTARAPRFAARSGRGHTWYYMLCCASARSRTGARWSTCSRTGPTSHLSMRLCWTV